MLPQHRTLHPLQCCSVVAGDTNACVCVRSRTRVFTHGLAHAFATAGSMSRVVYIWIILRVSTPRAKYLSCTERYLWFNSVTLPRPRISLSDSRRRAFIHARESRRMRVEILIKYKPRARRSISHSECETLNLKKKNVMSLREDSLAVDPPMRSFVYRDAVYSLVRVAAFLGDKRIKVSSFNRISGRISRIIRQVIWLIRIFTMSNRVTRGEEAEFRLKTLAKRSCIQISAVKIRHT